MTTYQRDPYSIPEVCEAPRCWARVEQWCPLCQQHLCLPHDSRHPCLAPCDDEDDESEVGGFPETSLPF